MLGYNKYDNLAATEVLADGIDQCNTKATLLMALLRAVGIPCRLYGTRVTKVFQRSLMPEIMANLAPILIVHTWAEVFYNGEWLSLEGVITDKAYISGLQNYFRNTRESFSITLSPSKIFKICKSNGMEETLRCNSKQLWKI